MLYLIMVSSQQARIVDQKTSLIDLLVRQVCGDSYLAIDIKRVKIVEDFEAAHIEADVLLEERTTGIKRNLQGQGGGFGETIFQLFMDVYAAEYASLNGLFVADFQVQADVDRDKLEGSYQQLETPNNMNTAISATARLTMRNSKGQHFQFEHRSTSLTRATVLVARDAVEFFIGCERAFMMLNKAYEDATSRGRADLAKRYQDEMATIVAATSYEAQLD